MGVFAGWFALRGETRPSLRLFLMTGVLGGFTTFSVFALDTATLWERNGLDLPHFMFCYPCSDRSRRSARGWPLPERLHDLPRCPTISARYGLS